MTNTSIKTTSNPSPEALKAAREAAIKLTNDALKQITKATRPDNSAKHQERRAAVIANKAERLKEKLTLLGTGKFEIKGKAHTLNVRRTLVEMIMAVNVGATAEQLRTAGIPGRFQWAGIEVPVRAYCAAKGDAGKLVLEVLFPAKVDAVAVAPEKPAATKKPATVKKAG